MVIRRAPTAILLQADAPLWAHRFAANLQSYFKLVHPVEPVELFAANKADLPLPADWRGCIAVVPDQHAIVVSDGTDWLKLTLGGPV